MNVIKRNGQSEPLNLEKVHQIVEFACEGVAGVSESAIEMNSNLQRFFDGIKSSEIQEILIKSASDLISLDALIISSLQHVFYILVSVSRYFLSGILLVTCHSETTCQYV